MRRYFVYKVFPCVPIAILGFFVFASVVAHADKSTVRMNEVQITGGTGKTNNDFIELYNAGLLPVVLDGWKLRKQTSSGTESFIRVFPAGSSIGAGEYFLWVNCLENFQGKYRQMFRAVVRLPKGTLFFLKMIKMRSIDSLACTNSGGKNAFAYDDKRKVWASGKRGNSEAKK